MQGATLKFISKDTWLEEKLWNKYLFKADFERAVYKNMD